MAGCMGFDEQDDSVIEAQALSVRSGISNNRPIRNHLGASASFSTDGFVNLTSAFFQDFGTNGRTCGTCHSPAAGWGISARNVRRRFARTRGRDPIFRLVDGANSPDADVSTLRDRREAYSMLLTYGTLRIGIGIPEDAEFELIDVDDPYGFASADQLSLFRRPLPAANLPFIPAVMWDGRETRDTLEAGLMGQANGATLGHAQAEEPLTDAEQHEIVDFELAMFSAQIISRRAGRLDRTVDGGPEFLAYQPLVVGPFDIFDNWQGRGGKKGAIARGQKLFNEGDGHGNRCSLCHATANVGSPAAFGFLDIGTAAGSRRPPGFPLYTLRNIETGETITSTDPGRALITGKWADINHFKGAVLRGLASRAPYFHNGMAATLTDVVDFYEESLGFDFTEDQEADLVAFLGAI
ncbi:MAG TPA: hypothetical protein VFG83_05040 [Kofleriaceae bacterium]|nr:hypothetical protein [Kofleriaceae bacterium]